MRSNYAIVHGVSPTPPGHVYLHSSIELAHVTIGKIYRLAEEHDTQLAKAGRGC